ncbi:MAG TPA: CRISPR-associated endoribonuclease Cas6 [Methanospirillum sp.]|uniref:CRISPR-associated endoribonuclease Cas6 n=1 Tax=Methanospirillum sp. TaxID=45200 RepID=UPI002CD92CB1|nr:CRISPR-associated endoribonuclease Cas6 [Methanospirillum sp.]HOJ96559.1 CRISPR-associated endoribonuclease Cas6 [Methanospirillum sp.]HPP78951.1 CRISPR-associated endoribonuclease Cas6 [Methanospirillum sp.]
MRILLELQNTQDQKDISLEYHKLQGFIYSLIKKSGFIGIHDKLGYKPFSFSNLFPFKNQKKGEIQKLIFATPGHGLGEAVFETLEKQLHSQIHIGDCEYILVGLKHINLDIQSFPFRALVSTPIILRIPEYNYDIYEIPEVERKPRYIYWRPNVPFSAFIKQLTENITKKYNDFYGTEIHDILLFEKYFFKKMVHSRLIIDGKSYGFAASIWSFEWSTLAEIQKKILLFGFDAGFGERNSMGFGFVNPIESALTTQKIK